MAATLRPGGPGAAPSSAAAPASMSTIPGGRGAASRGAAGSGGAEARRDGGRASPGAARPAVGQLSRPGPLSESSWKAASQSRWTARRRAISRARACLLARGHEDRAGKGRASGVGDAESRTVVGCVWLGRPVRSTLGGGSDFRRGLASDLWGRSILNHGDRDPNSPRRGSGRRGRTGLRIRASRPSGTPPVYGFFGRRLLQVHRLHQDRSYSRMHQTTSNCPVPIFLRNAGGHPHLLVNLHCCESFRDLCYLQCYCRCRKMLRDSRIGGQ
jgi:hypothetical protein